MFALLSTIILLMMILRLAISGVLAMLLCLRAWSQQPAPDTILQSKKDLNTVIVTGRKPLVTRKADRFIINVEGSILGNGNSGLEILQKSPGIFVDPGGRITVRGRGVTVMINDVVQRMSAEELAEYLKSLRSEDVSKIEVITNPGAEYEASGPGGIVNIVLKKARKDGFIGNAMLQYKLQSGRPYYNAGLSINYKISKLYLNASGGILWEWQPITDTSDLLYPDKTRLTTNADRLDRWTRSLVRAGIGYELSRDQFIEVQQSVNPRRWVNDFNTSVKYFLPNETFTGRAISHKVRRFLTGSTTLNYLFKTDTLGSKLTAIGEYSFNDKTEHNYFNEVYSGYFADTTYGTSVPFFTRIYSAQANYKKVNGNHLQWTSGIKYVDLQRDNEMITPKENNRFSYQEQLYMGYSSAEKTFKKMTYKAGLRVEHTRTSLNRRYTSFFPSASVMRILNEEKENSVFLNYVKRITRPGMNELNPARILYSRYTATQGNPGLAPQYSHNVEAGFNFLHGYSVSAQAEFTNDIINLLVVQAPDNVIDYVFANFGSSRQYGMSMEAPVTVNKWYSIVNNFTLSHLTYTTLDVADRTTFYAKTVHMLTPGWCDIELIADYRSPVEYPAFRSAHVFYVDAGITRRIMNKKARFRLYFSDIFNTVRELEITERATSKTIFYRKRPSRSVSLSFTYNFSGGIKFTNRTIESNNAAEKSRAGG